MGIVRADHRKLVDRVTEVELSTITVRPTLQELQTEVKNMAIDIATLHQKTEEAEGRSCRNNIRFLGFPEGSEKPNGDLFLETWLTDSVLRSNIPKFD